VTGVTRMIRCFRGIERQSAESTRHPAAGFARLTLVALVRAYEDDDYLPDYGLLLLVDPNVDWPAEDVEIPRYRDRGDKPAGSFAGSGAGWIAGQADGQADHKVRVELHDVCPPDDRDLFEDVVETPYRSSSGGLTLTTLTGGVGAPVFDLGDPEWFRVRIARRRDESGEFPLERWLFRFWPESSLDPPVWLARGSAGHGLPEDVEAVLRWTPRPSVEISAAELAGRLLIRETTLPGVLAAAEKETLLHADESGGAIWLTLGSRPAPEEPSSPPSSPLASSPPPFSPAPFSPADLSEAEMRVVAAASAQMEEMRAALEAAWIAGGHEHPKQFGFTVRSLGRKRPEPPTGPPFGPPPRAGIVQTDGTVVVWRDGAPVELANVGGAEQLYARETARGVLVTSWGQPARLVSPDGVVTTFDEPVTWMTVLGDGHRVALLDMHHHRRKSRYSLRILNLDDGSLEPMPWPEEREIALLGAYRDTIYFRRTQDPVDAGVAMRWTPGSDPRLHDCPVLHVDPVSGATCAPVADGARIDHPDGSTVLVSLGRWSRDFLAPGGDRLWQRPDPSPPEFHLIGVDGEARVWKLPWEGHSYGPPIWAGPVWEDRDTVLIGHGRGHLPKEPSCGVRIRVDTGEVERLPPISSRSRLATLVTPLITRQ
jgi:hypothetical protein